jgi:site-specific recombinase XerD
VSAPTAPQPPPKGAAATARALLLRVDQGLSSTLRPLSRQTYLILARHYITWCVEHKLIPFPAETRVFGGYIAALAQLNYKIATLQTRISAIAHIHRALGYREPSRTAEFQRIWKGIRRSRPVKPRSRQPLSIEELRNVIHQIPHDLRGLRDRAIILTAFAGALMPNELRYLQHKDVRFDEFMWLRIGEPRQRQVSIGPGLRPATCPVHAMREWLEVAQIERGYVFREINVHGNLQQKQLGSGAIRYIILKRFVAAGLDAAQYGTQSLRSGFYKEAALSGLGIEFVAKHAGIRSVDYLDRAHFKPALRWSDPRRSIDEQKPHWRRRRWHDD